MGSYGTAATAVRMDVDSVAHPAEGELRVRDGRAEEAIDLVAEMFVDDMLRLEREHGLNASAMLAYYKGDLSLKEQDEAYNGAGGNLH